MDNKELLALSKEIYSLVGGFKKVLKKPHNLVAVVISLQYTLMNIIYPYIREELDKNNALTQMFNEINQHICLITDAVGYSKEEFNELLDMLEAHGSPRRANR